MTVSSNDIKLEKTSALLLRLSTELKGEDVKIESLLVLFRRRSFGGLLLFLSILGLVPGVAVLSGFVMILLGSQMLMGYQSPKLPRVLSERTLPVKSLSVAMTNIALQTQKLESYIKPRYSGLASPAIVSLLGINIIGLAICIVIPLPFTNFFPSLAVMIMALGLIEKDGVLIAISFLMSLLAYTIAGWVTYIVWIGVQNLAF